MREYIDKLLDEGVTKFTEGQIEDLRNMVRERLTFGSRRLRFEMSGYDVENVGNCVSVNSEILLKFADLGIYNTTRFMVLDFYKGCGVFIYSPWDEYDENFRNIVYSEELGGLTTTEIIVRIIEITLFSGFKERRRIY